MLLLENVMTSMQLTSVGGTLTVRLRGFALLCLKFHLKKVALNISVDNRFDNGILTFTRSTAEEDKDKEMKT